MRSKNNLRMVFLVSTYVVCERLSVMHQPAKLPEIFDQILQNTPVLEFGSRTPPPPPKKIEIVPRVQVWLYPEHPRKWKTELSFKVTFFPEFKSELTQNTPPPMKMKNSNLLSWVQIWAYPEQPPHSSRSMWRLYPPRIPSSSVCECSLSSYHTYRCGGHSNPNCFVWIHV